MKHYAKQILLLGLFAAPYACSSQQEAISRKEQALDDLNHQDYEDAISLLQGLHDQAPNDSDIKILLASAYAGSVHFNVIDAFNAFSPLMYKSPSNSASPSLALDAVGALPSDPQSTSPTDPLNPPGGTQAAVDNAAANNPPPSTSATVAPGAPPVTPPVTAAGADQKSFGKLEREAVVFLNQLANSNQILATIPYIKVGDRRRVVQALLLLQDISADDSNHVKGKSYSALLNALQFLNYERDSLRSLVDLHAITSIDAICAVQPQIFIDNLDTSTSYINHAVDDLTVVYQASTQPMPDGINKLKEAADHVLTTYQANKAEITDANVAFAATKAAYCP